MTQQQRGHERGESRGESRRRGQRGLDPRQQAAMALGSLLLLAELVLQIATGEVNVALAGAGVSIFGLAFTLPRDGTRNRDDDGSGDGRGEP